ncbi:MAG: zf-HC2 domain-containing protein [Pyrinomonadaceae bacterium]
MKCEECTTAALEELLDGEFDERRAAAMSAHLASCQSCALRYEALFDEQAMFANYERDVEVTPRIWSAVAARIAAEGKPAAGGSWLQKIRARLAFLLIAPRFSPALTAAMMLFAVGLTVGLMKYADSQQATPGSIAVAPTTKPPPRVDVAAITPAATPTITAPIAPAGPDDSAAAVVNVAKSRPERKLAAKPAQSRRRDAARNLVVPVGDQTGEELIAQNGDAGRRQQAMVKLVNEAEAKYLAAIKMLSQDVNRRRSTLDPQVAARFDETLATIDRTIAETRRTVVTHGNDPVAVQYMLSAYAKKVEVLREMATLD